MKIAVIGAGVSGLTAAYYLGKDHRVTVFEANSYAGGHTHTHSLCIGDKVLAVDSGFIVFNEENYPNFTQLLRELEVEWQDSDMSFSAVNERTGMEYGADGLHRLLAQKRNLITPGFYRMLWDLLRFYREAPKILKQPDSTETLGAYLQANRYSRSFIENHIIPMACALWSAPSETIENFPVHYFVSFMANHRMLQLGQRPQWKVIKGGSSQYVKKLFAGFSGHLRLNTPVMEVRREARGASIKFENASTERHGPQTEYFDVVIFACHSDQALALLADPSESEMDVLGSIPYQKNKMTLHSDTSVMPKYRQAWASWNARIPAEQTNHCSVSYWMNNLQGLDCNTPLIVSLNAHQDIDREKIWTECTYHHPVYTLETIKAQKKRHEINGKNNTYFCGAYWGWGFHEDGVRSALDVVELIQRDKQNVAA